MVGSLHDILLRIGRGHETLDFSTRRELLMDVLPTVFHTGEMARFAMGEHWIRLTTAQRQVVMDGYAAQLSAMLADRFSFDYGHTFNTLAIDRGGDGDIWAAVEIVLPFGYRHPLRYLLRNDGVGPKIIDLLPEGGVSALQTRKDEYQAVIRRKGLGGFLAALRSKTDAIQSR